MILNKKKLLIFFCMLMICFISVLVPAYNKESYHVDEVFTYQLSNNTADCPFFYWFIQGIGPADSPSRKTDFECWDSEEYRSFYNHWHNGQYFHDAITVQDSETFNYSNVIRNQENDLHPPAYYFIIHTLSSFFPDKFSKWFGLIPNLFFSIITLVLLFLSSQRMGNDYFSSISCMLLWGFSRAAMCDTTFIRMYCMLTMITMLSLYLHFLFLNSQRIVYVLLISAFCFPIGFLTQYEFYFVAFPMGLITCMYLICKKRFRWLFGYIATTISSVVLSIAVFPAVFLHTLGGTYASGDKSFFEKKLSLSVYRFFYFFNRDFLFDFNPYGFPNYTFTIISVLIISVILVIVFAVLLLRFLKAHGDVVGKNGDDKNRKDFTELEKLIKRHMPDKYILLIGGTLLFGVFAVGCFCPEMYTFGDRYYFILFPIFILLLVSAISRLFNGIKTKKYLRNAVLIIFIATVSVANVITPNPYYMKTKSPDIGDYISGKDCFFINLTGHSVNTNAIVFQKANRVFVSDGNIEALVKEINEHEDECILISTYKDVIDPDAKQKGNKLCSYYQNNVKKKTEKIDEIVFSLENSVQNVYRIT